MSPEFLLSSQNHFQCCDWWLSDDQLNQSPTELKPARWKGQRAYNLAFLPHHNLSRIIIAQTDSNLLYTGPLTIG
jgi:hypothetical protein